MEKADAIATVAELPQSAGQTRESGTRLWGMSDSILAGLVCSHLISILISTSRL
jgi:hypothetical protein